MSDQDYVYDEATGEWLSPSEAAEKAAASVATDLIKQQLIEHRDGTDNSQIMGD